MKRTMKIPENIQHIEVYYDGRCGMCCSFHEWVNEQQRAFAVRFVAYQSPRAEEWFPGVNELEPDREMVVRTDDGTVYRGAEGWVLCLLSCMRYQGVARRLVSPVLMPVAKKTCYALAARRRGLSKIFFRNKDREVAVELHRISGLGCEGECQLATRGDIPDGLI
jgi:predicted DCC family thiol-disulfide oxidoreductase YuxK